MAELVITSANFEKEVLESDIPVLLDFWATWCGPCRMLGPVIAEIAEEYEGKIKVGKVNVDEEGELANEFRVNSIPFVVLMKNGEIVKTSIGYKPKSEIEALLK
ncbi:MAG: thioredoxin [Clostridia bacterium]|nr:thioredoxin [Clostridia bacterium]MBQ7727512.1 thioredoxin [Clostridia bacterium]